MIDAAKYPRPRILVTGGRNYKNRDLVLKTLNNICTERGWKWPEDAYGNWLPRVTIVHGGCKTGADSFADDFAVVNWTPLKVYEADWKDLSQPNPVIRTRRDGTKYDAKAGMRRNQQMLDDADPDLVVAFPGGPGTADMVNRAVAGRYEIVRVEDDNL